MTSFYKRTLIAPILASAICLLTLASATHAQLITPQGLNPGDQFRFVFITDGTRNAAPSDINVYNAWVQGQAAGATYNDITIIWKAIGSTPFFAARDNVGQTLTPVYEVDGTLITPTTTATGLWSGTLLDGINKNLAGDVVSRQLWTGTDPVGVQRWGLELGPLNQPYDVGVGLSGSPNSSWVTSGTDRFNRFYHMYAISEVLTAVPVPEPSGLIAIGMGIAIVFTRRNRR